MELEMNEHRERGRLNDTIADLRSKSSERETQLDKHCATQQRDICSKQNLIRHN